MVTQSDSTDALAARADDGAATRRRSTAPAPEADVAPMVFEIDDLDGLLRLVPGRARGRRSTSARHEITAFIGPSGCGKTTVLRCLNRMNDLIPAARVEGTVRYHGVDLYGPTCRRREVRRRIGMVFQKPNPFPKSIYDNVAFGPRINGVQQEERPRRHRRESRCAAPRCGTRSRTGSKTRRSACRAASSSGCASPAPSRSSPR